VQSSTLSGADTGLDPRPMPNSMTSAWLRRAGMLVLISTLVLTGSYVRTRPADESNTADWLVMVQIGVCIAGGCLGVLLIRTHFLSGFGAKALLAYLVAIVVSGSFSDYRELVFGYWVLLAGAGLLCIGLISSSGTADSLRGLESVIFATLSAMLLKDTILNLFFLEVPDIDSLYRLGWSVTSPNSMGLTAAIAFGMSFIPSEGIAGKIWKNSWRVLFFVIILLTRSRIALFALLVGIVVRWWFASRQSREIRSYALLIAIPCAIAGIGLLAVLSWLMGSSLMADGVDFVNRGADRETMISVTGRTEIWPYALQRVSEGPLSIIFGYGYGASRFVLNENNWTATFYAFHAHNTFIEVILTTGLLGALPFLVLMAYSLKWFARFKELYRPLSLGFALRATTVVSSVLTSTMTEADLAVKIGPIAIVYLFYLLSLDRQAAFSLCKTTPTH
jgi:hypothetical protein